MRRIVCAAIRNQRLEIILGIRHYDPIMRKQIRGRNIWKPEGVTQGFVDQMGIFLTRREAWPIAEAAGQIVNRPACSHEGVLYSEHLY